MVALTKKVCLIGDFGVGKTSLVARYVNNVYCEKYLTTVGVKIDTKDVSLPQGDTVRLVIWDIAGTDRFTSTDTNYLRGAAAYLLVVDGTRRNTLDTALQLKAFVDDYLQSPPFVVLLNKCDLHDQWEISDADVDALIAKDWPLLLSSAKQGENVAEAFDRLANALLP